MGKLNRTPEQQREILRLRAKIFRERYKANGPSIIRTEKQCCQCEFVKPVAEFARSICSPDWRSSTCRSCSYEKTKQWRKQNPERQRKLGQEQSRRAVLSGTHLKYTRKYYAKNKQKCRESARKWHLENKEAANAGQLRWHKAKYASDENYRFGHKMRAKVRLLLRGVRKSAPTEILLGCKIADLRKWLELHWLPGMSWENYGLHGWHIDHKRPVASFDLAKPEDQRACFHHTNLQPLWAKDNIRKSDTLNHD